ncbi:MAG TPA: helix-turn-helix domain-containing protein [Xanthobacteraceae bacterium]|jgi:AcrR family transcriptional regulator|nr:helix-turn-helix domain-containing protein [Xanthobacteraceae bacterium]
MAKKKFQPAPALVLQIEKAFAIFGYSKLTMRALAKECNFSTRALYFYFSNKEEAFRALVRFRNDLSITMGFAAGQRVWTTGGNALDILAETINVRYGDTRRVANASPHLVELNAEVFTRCNDIVTEVALRFEEQLAKLIVKLEDAGLLQLEAGVTAKQMAEALANGARGVNQRLPAVPPKDLAARYHEMCRFILYGGAEIEMTGKRTRPKSKMLKHK